MYRHGIGHEKTRVIMIEVNLIVGKKPMQMPKIAGADIRAIKVKHVVIGIVFYYASSYMVDFILADKKQDVETRRQNVQKEVTTLRKEVTERKSIEQQKENLIKQEQKLKAKLEVVRKIIQEKKNPMKILLYVSKNILL